MIVNCLFYEEFFLNLIIIFFVWFTIDFLSLKQIVNSCHLKLINKLVFLCVNFSLNFTFTFTWQFWGMKRSGRCFQRVIYQKFCFEDFGKNAEKCVIWKWPLLLPYTIENERLTHDCVTSKLTVPYANYFVKSFWESPILKWRHVSLVKSSAA